MQKLFFLTDNIITKRDYNRFGINFLKKKFDVKIISLVNYINPLLSKNHYNFQCKELIKINTLNKLNRFLSMNKKLLIIDFLGSSKRSWLVRNLIQKKNIKIISIYCGLFPTPSFSFFERVINLFNKRKRFGGNLLHKLQIRFFNYLNKDYKPNITLVGGDVYTNLAKQKKIKHIVKSHSWDYDSYLKLKDKKIKKKNYAVFIDCDVVFHPDYIYHNITPPARPKEYFQSLNSFFSKIEEKYNLEIKIAASPKTNKKKIEKYLFGRKIYYNKTQELVRDSKAVFMHASTSIFFPLKFNKPLTFITCNELRNSWFEDQIIYFAKLLNKKILNIDSESDVMGFSIFKSTNKSLIKKYLKLNDKSKNTKDVLMWKSLSDYIINNRI